MGLYIHQVVGHRFAFYSAGLASGRVIWGLRQFPLNPPPFWVCLFLRLLALVSQYRLGLRDLCLAPFS